MRCISNFFKRFISILLVASLAIGFTGCGDTEVDLEYDLYKDSARFGLIPDRDGGDGAFYASDKCIGTTQLVGDDSFKEQAAAYGVFDDTSKEIRSCSNLFEKIYPASTTKILTALVALKHGDLKQVITVPEEAVTTTAGTSVAGFMTGDKVSLGDLLYALMICSGNDAAYTIACGISGSVPDFANLMNEEAAALGATHSHFVNPHGLHDDMHYTCAYDMYLIFHKAISDPAFLRLIKKSKKKITYQHGDGSSATATYTSTNQYLTGVKKMPKNIKIIGGKTGTTNSAGYCLVVYGKEKKTKHQIIGIVYNADTRDSLYSVMSGIMSKK